MSLILDALKKIEQDKRRSDGSQIESIAVSRGRFGGRQHVLSMAAIAVGSALLAAAAVSFLNNNRQGTEEAEAEAATVPVATSNVEAPPVEPVEPVEPVKLDTPRPAAAPPVVAETKEASVRAREPAPAPVSDPEPASIEEAPDDSTQPIRLVGRERVLLSGLGVGDAAESFEHDDAEPQDSEPLPDDFPDLVLQGTSVIGNDAVAVISDERVFEGDRIQGALVIRIGEREVELELDGRRFTLHL